MFAANTILDFWAAHVAGALPYNKHRDTLAVEPPAQDAPREIASEPASLLGALRRHWPEYLMEGAGLGIFMFSACFFGVLLDYPGSPAQQAIADPVVRRVLQGCAMGLTLIAIVYSPWGKQSGAHLNPAFTLTFFRLGKIKAEDAAGYILAQFAGGVAGVLFAAAVLGAVVMHPSVNYVVTRPGPGGVLIAFAAEFAISFLLMLMILNITNTAALAHYTGVFAGALVATYISLEAPLSGMSMNPARTFGSAFAAGQWTALWVYFTAPPLAMLAAAEVYVRMKGARAVYCAKLHHANNRRCIFRCRYPELMQAAQRAESGS